MNTWYFEFQYDLRGFGSLILREGNLISLIYEARSGSIDVDGDLINPIKPGIWTIRDKPIPTQEIGMVVDTDKPAYKIRLHTPKGRWSHYLIHADGNKPGSLGCIAINKKYGNESILYKDVSKILTTQEKIKVYINTEVPLEVKNGIA